VDIPLGSTVTKALLYADVHGSDGYFGGLELTFLNSITGAEQTWDAKGSDCGQAFSPIVGSGMLVGAQCWAAEAIDALGLIFLREITWGSQELTLGKVPCSTNFVDIVEPGKVHHFASSKTCKSAPTKHAGCSCKLTLCASACVTSLLHGQKGRNVPTSRCYLVRPAKIAHFMVISMQIWCLFS
jgi:hypothetical protein